MLFRLLHPRNLALFSMATLGSGYLMAKPRTLVDKTRADGDYTVTVDRSGGGL